MRQIQTSLLSNRRARRWRSRLTGCLVAFLVVNPSGVTETWAAADRPQSGKTVTVGSGLQFHNGLLTAHVRATPLPQVLSEVSRLSGAKVVWLGQPDLRQVSVTFTALPIAEAIPRVLGGNNFLLVYASTEDKARLKEIWIATRPSPTQTGISPTLESAPMTEGINVNEGDSELTQESAPMPEEDSATEVEAELAKMLESQLDTALHGADRNSRIEAIGVLGGLVEQDPRIRPLLQQLSTSERDPQVRTAAAATLAESGE
jgi:hypothetical protein